MFDLDRTRDLISQIVSADGMDLVDVEFKGTLNNRVLRIYIDKSSGVTLDDCTLVSNHVGTVLDVEDLVPGSYTLEVSSPGLTRKLTKPSDYQRYKGRLIKIQTKEPVEGKRSLKGTLLGLENDSVQVDIPGSGVVAIPLGSISKAHLDIDF
ncbi:MAG: ribosome maturation factor RimP [Acidobacteriota bacterium]